MGGRPKFTFEKVQKVFSDRGCILLETEYPNDRTPLRYIAACGHERTSTFNNFYRGKGTLCRVCRYAANGAESRLGEEVIRRAFEKEGMAVLDIDGGTQSSKVRYIASCGHENVTDYDHFVHQHGGRVCAACSKSIRYKIDYVRECFEERGCLLLEDVYINCKTKMRYIAQCGHESYITFDALLNSDGAALRCRKCHKHTYHEEPIDRNRYASKAWRKAVYERDGFTCAACGHHGGDLNAHHLDAYDMDEAARFDVSNGVTLCPTCHIRFHREYGFGGNTKGQFEKWMQGNTEVRVGNKSPATP